MGNVEKYVWIFMMGISFGIGLIVSLLDLTGYKDGILLGLFFIAISILGVSQTNNIFDAKFDN